jgi:hypothetical protein
MIYGPLSIHSIGRARVYCRQSEKYAMFNNMTDLMMMMQV